MVKAWNADIGFWGDLGVCFGCVVRVESTEQECTTSLGDESCREMLPGRFPREMPVAGTRDRERSRSGVSSWDEAPGWEVLFSTG